MKVILLKDVPKVGSQYEIKDVSSGFARNFLLAKKLAEPASVRAVSTIEKRKASADYVKKAEVNLLITEMEKLSDVKITIKEKANEQGSLFAGIHKEKIISTIKEQLGANITEEMIFLDGPIKELGEYNIPVSAGDKKNKFTINIEAVE